MESGRSPKKAEDDTEFHSESKADCGEGIILKNSRDGRENLEGNSGSALGSSTDNQTVVRFSFANKNEKPQNGCEVNAPDNSNPKIYKQICYGTKFCSLQKFNNIWDQTVLKTEGNSFGISKSNIADKRVSDTQTSLARTSSFDVSDESDSEIGIGSLRIYDTVSSEENASGNDLLQTSNLLYPGESASKNSYLPTGNLFSENNSGRGRNLSSEEIELYEFQRKLRNKTRDQKDPVRKQRQQFHAQKSKDKAYDFQSVSQSQCERNPFDLKLTPFEIGCSTVKETTTDSKDNLTRMSNPTVPDARSVKSKGHLIRKYKPEVSEDSSLENNSGFPYLSGCVSSDEHISESKAGLSRISIPAVNNENFLNSAVKGTIDPCKESTIRMNSLQKNELFKSSETTKSPDKRKKKLKKKNPQSHYKVGANRRRNYPVPSNKTLEIQIGSLNKSSGIHRYLTGDEIASENIASEPEINESLEHARRRRCIIAEDTSKKPGIFSFNYLSFLPKSSKNIPSVDTSNPQSTDMKMKGSKWPHEASLGNHPNGLRQSSSAAKLDVKAKSLKVEPGRNHRDSSKKVTLRSVRGCFAHPNRNSSDSRNHFKLHLLSHLSSNRNNARNRSNASKSRQPINFGSCLKKVNLGIFRDGQPNWNTRRNRFNHLLSVNKNRSTAPNRRQPILSRLLKNKLQTSSLKEHLPWTNDEHTRLLNRNLLDNSKTDSSKTNDDNNSEWWTPFSIDSEESSEVWDIVRAVFSQILVFTANEYICNYFNFIFFLIVIALCILYN